MKIKYAKLVNEVFTPDAGSLGTKLSLTSTVMGTTKVSGMTYADGILTVDIRLAKGASQILIPTQNIASMQAIVEEAPTKAAPSKKGLFS